jgi:GNAT superfamily N-acetyltransferase
MIRKGELEDIPAVVRMSGDFWQHSAFDEEFIERDCAAMAEDRINDGLLFIYESNGEAHGFIALVVGPLMVNFGVNIGTEIAWWVDPDHRAGRAGIGLLKAAEDAAKDRGCKYMGMLYMESSMPEAIKTIYERSGYRKSEANYLKRFD